MTISKRLLGLGASAAIIFAACGGAVVTKAPVTAPPVTATGAPVTAAPVTAVPATAVPATAIVPKNYKACVSFDTGGLGDKSFNDLAKKGIDDAKANGYDTAYSIATSLSDYADNIQRLIDKKCQSIITIGFNQGKATVAAVAANPTIAFSQVDTSWGCGPDFKCGTADDKEPANFTGLDYQVDQAAMVAGYLAAAWTKTGKVATYGGQSFPGVTRFMDGFYAGVQYYNQVKSKTVKVLGWDGSLKDPTTTGTFVGGDGSSTTWNNPTLGENFAKTFIDQGVDIILPVAGGTGNGTIKALIAAKGAAVGVDQDQWYTLGQPLNAALLTSAQKAIDTSMLAVLNKNFGGDLGGEDYSGTLKNGGVLVAPYHDFDSQFSAELKAELTLLQEKISGGVLTVCSFLGRGC